MSADGTSSLTLHFFGTDYSEGLDLAFQIREQHKALMWLHMDAGKTRAPRTLLNTNLALAAWCEKAFDRGVDLYSLLTNPELLVEESQSLNLNYLDLTSSALRTLWRHRKELGAPAEIQLQALRESLNREARARPDTHQTPLIPSRIYSSVLANLVDRLDLIEAELDSLLAGTSVETLSRANLDIGRLAEYQLTLMLTVSAFTGMRIGEVSILPLENVLVEFEHLGSVHFEVQGFTHKLHRGVKRATSWITNNQGARAVRIAQRIARLTHPKGGSHSKSEQISLLFPSAVSPYQRIAASSIDRRLKKLRETICPVIEQSDIDELDRLELSRGWAREEIVVGGRWPLAFHQLRRSLAVYAHRSGMVSLPALKAQLQHITHEMTAYYSDGFCRAVNLVFDQSHFSHEWQAAKAESSYFAYALGVLFSDEEVLGLGAQRMANAVESRSIQDTLRLFAEGKLAYRETPLGGCASTEACQTEPLEPIPYHCLESNCTNLVVLGKRLTHIIKSQELAVATLANDDKGSVEYRLELRNLEVLLKARERLTKGGK